MYSGYFSSRKYEVSCRMLLPVEKTCWSALVIGKRIPDNCLFSEENDRWYSAMRVSHTRERACIGGGSAKRAIGAIFTTIRARSAGECVFPYIKMVGNLIWRTLMLMGANTDDPRLKGSQP